MFVLLEQRVREVPHIPVSILSNHTTHDYGDLVRLCDLWAGSLQWRWTPRVTLELFDRTRGRDLDSPRKWGEYWRPLERAAETDGTEKFGAPLICGAGETRQEIQKVAQNIRGMGNHNHNVRAVPGARFTDGRRKVGAATWAPDATGTCSH